MAVYGDLLSLMQRQVASEGTAVFGTFILLFYLDFMFCFVLF